MNITIVGGGNVGTQFAVHCATKGHRVVIYTNKYKNFKGELNIIDDKNNIFLSGKNVKATNDKVKAFNDADLIFVTVPAFCMEEISSEIFDYVKSGVYIGLVPGTGGSECAFKKYLDKNCVIFGLQRVPSVARLIEYGNSVLAQGYRDKLHVAAIPNIKTKNCCEIVSNIFDMPCVELPNYLNVTLTPSNPILHTTRLYSLFENYKDGRVYSNIPLFYEEWDDKSSELLLKCDEELQNICKYLRSFDLRYVKSLKEHYESNTVEKMSLKIRSIKSLQGLKTPSVQVGENQYIPDLSSRYFLADFPFGIKILKQIARFVGVNTPNIDKIWNWYSEISNCNSSFSYAYYGIKNIDDFNLFYSI